MAPERVSRIRNTNGWSAEKPVPPPTPAPVLIHHRDGNFPTRRDLEILIPGVSFLERSGPSPLEVEGIRQHQHGLGAHIPPRKEPLDLAPGLLLHPGVDGLARRLRVPP